MKESQWNLLFIMQRHGVKTRLLDWSESFAVALFFTCDKWALTNCNSAIWLLDSLGLNELTLDERMFYSPDKDKKYTDFLNSKSPFYDNSLALYPLRNNNRIVSQHGMFTIPGKAAKPLEEEHVGQLIDLNILKKIEITPTVKKDELLYFFLFF
ncbi:FRG domain-containing protein [Priestia aryabhattai]|uniref:FRG domain-containing protein n=1 Tax=Priestia aryabhattai TaxID=412384 RepID=UPI002658FBDD|nr:FRG domain-containing protein [Priestia aryabhattai]WKG33399.1 FRG domain-containing protein [Priestia aryabhattai]